MARSTYIFHAWSSTGGAGNAHAWVNVDWNYDKSAKKITITGVSYGGSNIGWYVGSSMKMGIAWSDGTESVLAVGTYNYPYQATSSGAGFITISGVLGVFSDANNHCSVSHTFSGTSGGFGVRFGSTAFTINAGNPQSYRDLERTGGDTPSVVFSTPPSNAGISSSSITCSSAAITGSYTAGVGSTNQQRIEWSTDGFKTYSTSSYSTSNPWTYTITGLEPATTYSVRSYVKNDTGGTNSSTISVTTKGSYPTLGTPTATNPQVYRAVFKMPSVSWGECGSNHTLTLTWKYTADGTTHTYSKTWTGSDVTSASHDTGQLIPTTSQYFTAVPDDETIEYTWTATKQFGSKTAYAVRTGTLYCQPSYTAYVIEAGVNNGQPVEAEMFVGGVGQKPTSKIRRVESIV